MNYKKIIFLILELLNNWPNVPVRLSSSNSFSFVFSLDVNPSISTEIVVSLPDEPDYINNHTYVRRSSFMRSFKLVPPVITIESIGPSIEEEAIIKPSKSIRDPLVAKLNKIRLTGMYNLGHIVEPVDLSLALHSDTSREIEETYVVQLNNITPKTFQKDLMELIDNINSSNPTKNFSTIIFYGGLINKGAHTISLIIDHTHGNLMYLFDPDPGIYQIPNTGNVNREIFGSLAEKIVCLNSIGSTIQADDACTYIALGLAKILNRKSTIEDVVMFDESKGIVEFLPYFFDELSTSLNSIDNGVLINTENFNLLREKLKNDMLNGNFK